MPVCPEVYEPPPQWLPVTSNFVLLLTIPTSVYTFYLIAAVTPPHTDFYYKMYLLSYHTIASLYSIVNALLIVVQYMPSFIFIEMGILRIYGFTFVVIDLMLEILSQVIGLLVLVYRFMLVIYGGRKKSTIQTVLSISSFFYILPQALLLISVFNLYSPDDDQNNLLRDCPQMKQLIDSYDPIYIDAPGYLDIFGIAFLVAIFVSTICFGGVLLFCSQKFRERAQFLSETTKKLQTRVLFNLAITLSIPSIAHGLPAIIASLIFSLKMQVPLWVSILIWFMGSFHGIVNCIVFISLNDYYYNRMWKDLGGMTAFVTTILPGKKIHSETQTQTI